MSTDATLFSSPDAVLDQLRRLGLRISTTRRALVEALFAADEPVSAEQIAAGLDGRSIRLDPASVYRNLEALGEAGLVRRLSAGRAAGRYVLAGPRSRGYAICDRCGGITAAECHSLVTACAELEHRFGYQLDFGRFPLVGICPRCRR